LGDVILALHSLEYEGPALGAIAKCWPRGVVKPTDSDRVYAQIPMISMCRVPSNVTPIGDFQPALTLALRDLKSLFQRWRSPQKSVAGDAAQVCDTEPV
jgi:hypothetical protein